MRGTTSRAANGGRHAQPKRRAAGAASLLPALTSGRTRGADDRPGRRRAEGSPRAPRPGGSHRASRDAAPLDQALERVTVLSDERPLPWARTVAFSGVTGVAALTVGFTVLTDPDSASGFSVGAAPQETAAVTVIEREQQPGRQPVARRSAPAEYAVPRARRAPAADSRSAQSTPAPAAATPTGRPAPAPAPAPTTPAAPQAPESSVPAPAPSPEQEEPTPGLLDELTGPLGDTVTGVVGVLPDLG